MNYWSDRGWRISFTEDGSNNPLPKRLVFLDASKILEMYIRWGETKTAAEVAKLERSLAGNNPGGVWLVLSEEQYRALM